MSTPATLLGRPRVHFPRAELRPLAAIGRRLLLAGGLILLVTVVVYLDRGGYTDDADGVVSLADAFYYATVTITTTGYGDITPLSDVARLLTAVVVTPARVLFLVLLVGTTLEILTERSREALHLQRWRRRVRDHYIVCGFGTLGRSAIAVLRERGVAAVDIVVVDRRAEAVAEAAAGGFATVHGDATRTAVLSEARIARAKGVIVAADRDETTVLVTLTARELNAVATIVAAAREEENAHLLRQSGATAVVTTAHAAGRMLGIATDHPGLVDVVEDLLTLGRGVDIDLRAVTDAEVRHGAPTAQRPGELPVAVVRGDRTLPLPRAGRLRAGDRLICVRDVEQDDDADAG